MIRLRPPTGLRTVPLRRSVTLARRRATADFTYSVGSDGYVFTTDIYAYWHHTHPDRHLGWWRFDLPASRSLRRRMPVIT